MVRLGIVGAGRVGTALALACSRTGIEVVAVASRSEKSVERLVQLAGLDRSVVCSSPNEAFERSSVLLLSVSDDAIGEVCLQLTKGVSDKRASEPGFRVVAHLSGALSSSILSPLRKLGASVGSIHPIKSFSTDPHVSSDLKGTVASIEGDEGAVQTLSELAGVLGMRPTEIASEAKPLYHAAACIASNYMVTLFALSCDIMVRSGMDPALARESIAHLMGGTMRNLQSQPPEQALTGPIARGDSDTIKGHLDALERIDNCRVNAIYRLLGLETAELAKYGKRISSESVDELTSILS
jgi:predicted short-subunit dehydrogenase-like oxidoreductase (DUF2520 family)